MADRTPLNLEAIRSGINELCEIQRNCHDDANLITSDEDDFLKEYVFQVEGKSSEIIEELSDISSLQAEDFDTYMENLKGELCSVEAEFAILSDEVGNLTKSDLEDSIQLQSNIEGLNSCLEFIESQGLETKKADARFECSSLAEHQPEPKGAHDGCKFKIFPNDVYVGEIIDAATSFSYVIASHTTNYQHPMLFLNTVAVIVLVIAKFPNMHKVRIFGINGDM